MIKRLFEQTETTIINLSACIHLNKETAFLKAFSIFLCIILAATLISVSLFAVANAAISDFEDDFETGKFYNWNGFRASSGETIGVSSYRSYLGAYAGRATSNGGGDFEYAYCYKQISSSELHVRGVVYVAKSGIVQEGDRFDLIALQSGKTTLATVGWKANGGQVKWFLLVNGGTEWPIAYSEEPPVLNKWYSVELYWKKNAVNGESRLWVGSPVWGGQSEVCTITGKNTAAYGDVSELRLGLPRVSYCGNTAVYFDCVKTSSEYIGEVYELGWDKTIFSDDFESGRFNKWSEAKTYKGGKVSVVNTLAQAGSYSAKFTVCTSGQAYCYKNLYLPEDFADGGRLFRFNGCYKLATCLIRSNGGRVYLFRAWDGNTEIIAAGIEKTPNGMRWFLERKDGATTVTAYSTNAPVMNKWCQLKISWNPFEYTWGTTCCDLTVAYTDGGLYETLSTSGQNTIVYDTIDRIDVGLPKTVNCRSATVYCDSIEIVTWEWE